MRIRILNQTETGTVTQYSYCDPNTAKPKIRTGPKDVEKCVYSEGSCSSTDFWGLQNIRELCVCTARFQVAGRLVLIQKVL